MKKLLLIAALAYLASGCQLNPNKPWIVVSKDRNTEYQRYIGICYFKVSDGWNEEYFYDSCGVLNVGDTVHGKKSIARVLVSDTIK